MRTSTILNTKLIQNTITNNGKEGPVPYRWSHGANDIEMGDGLLVYSFIQFIRAKTCVCIGSGGGFIPRIMTQARRDMWEMGVFGGNNDFSWGDIGCTYVVDAMNGIGGKVDWFKEESFFRRTFHPRILGTTTEEAFHNHFVLNDVKIDYLHIDAGHSYENVKEDFELYSQLLSPNGIISIHDTDPNFADSYLVTNEVKDRGDFEDWNGPIQFVKELKENPKWETFDLFNFGIVKNKPASTGLTLVKRK
jgi:hypothetical protein